MKVYLHSFGCRVNQYEGERVRQGFLAGGSVVAEDYRDADVSVINTCSVTDEADKEARAVIRRIYRENPSSFVIITGCYASRSSQELQALFPEALIVGNEAKDAIPSLAGCSLGLGGAAEGRSISSFFGRTRAWVKVQDGCNMRCSYCIIPTTRPTVSCRPPEEILFEIKALLENGYKEIVLCGIRLGRYWAQEGRHSGPSTPLRINSNRNPGLDPGLRRGDGGEEGKWVDLLGLIQRISAFDGDFRIRLSSIEITDLTDRFLEGYVAIPKTVPYFHVPLQAGSDAVLRAMKRWYRTAFYARRLEAVRGILGKDAALFTDFMVGFPTETGGDFEDSLTFAKAMVFAGMHIFRYSPRQGTPAAVIEPCCTCEELQERLKRTRELDQEFRIQFAGRFAGRTLNVLAEQRKQDGVHARAENFLEVLLPLSETTGKGWMQARILKTKGPRLIGTLDPGISIPLVPTYH